MFNEHRTHRTWVLGLSASMLAGRNSHQTIPRTRGNNPKVKRLLGCTIPYTARETVYITSGVDPGIFCGGDNLKKLEK